jgi:hypothetical protein
MEWLEQVKFGTKRSILRGEVVQSCRLFSIRRGRECLIIAIERWLREVK